MATDITQAILDELARQGKSRYWLVHNCGLAPNSVYAFLRGEKGARQDGIEAMLDTLDLRLVPGELADTIDKGKGASKPKAKRTSKAKSKRTSKGKRRRKTDK